MSALDFDYLAKLASLAKAGDKDAFSELYAATYQRQYLYALRYLGDGYLAQDALQETYILAFRNLDKLKNPVLVYAWLNQINFRVCFNMQKKHQLHQSELGGTNREADVNSPPSEQISPDGSPEEQLLASIDREYLMDQILKLPYTESQAVILKYYRGLKYKEIARLLDISSSSVKRYLKQARRKLANMLAEDLRE